MSDVHIVIVGGGPMATYAVSHLAAVLPRAGDALTYRLSVFDRGGRFGAGDVHSDLQARSSYLNRVAAQIAFAADESSTVATRLLPPSLRPTFHEWCQERFAETGNPVFDLRPWDVPKRYVHGMALRDMFGHYVAWLRQSPNITVDLYEAEVTDMTRRDPVRPPFLVHSSAGAEPLAADHVLFVTGHSRGRPYSGDGPGIAPYPLAQQLTTDAIPAGQVVAVSGLGLTAIDVILHLTEGRGGQFTALGDGLTYQYQRSGHEPTRVIAFSPSGIPVAGRAKNQKVSGPGPQHSAVFFTMPAISALRRNADVTANGGDRRLDFSRHLLPLVMLEMAYVYYKTLLGPRFAASMKTAVASRYQHFLAGDAPWAADGADFLIAPAQSRFERACARVEAMLGSPPGTDELADSFCEVLYGPPSSWPSPGAPSPWGHSLDIRGHRFDWRRTLTPIAAGPSPDPSWPERVLGYLLSDVGYCAQGNVSNPLKAACDGVWRDLRAEFSAAVDNGGLRPASHREFMDRYVRYYNRLSNGAGLMPMRKFVALISEGLVDLSVGPRAVVHRIADGRLEIAGPVTGVSREADVHIDARIHPFDPASDSSPLYRNLLRSGLVQQWRNSGGPGELDFRPGALDLDEGYHPRSASGSVDRRLTFLGAPADGLRLFQLSAARPRSDSYVLNNAIRWAEGLVAMATGSTALSDPAAKTPETTGSVPPRLS
jgi:hypothetical protein